MSDEHANGEQQPYRAGREVLRGVSWAIVMRWSIRGIGLVSTVILARLLTPEDFGVAAMGMLVIGMLYALSEFGTSMHLIRVQRSRQGALRHGVDHHPAAEPGDCGIARSACTAGGKLLQRPTRGGRHARSSRWQCDQRFLQRGSRAHPARTEVRSRFPLQCFQKSC
ncbi:MAG: oligosaccharide flippase family protein [Halofilum sp. (in: g-proteobacteria)]|nr:oligosaccharide flippase family protein [Halofilum sp. (in: g-proteobacteria)]